MQERRQYQYRIAQPRDFLITSAFSSDSTAMRKDSQLYKSERVQPSVDDRLPPIFVDLAAARRNKSSFSNDYERYSTNINVDRSNSPEMQQFIAADKRKSLQETTKNKKTTRPDNWPQSSRSSPSHRHYRSNDSSCCCQCDKCCDKCCDNCVDVCCDCDVFVCCLEICCKIGCSCCE
jgi:hypothetical protein